MAQALVWMQIATQLLEFINLFTARASPLYTVRWGPPGGGNNNATKPNALFLLGGDGTIKQSNSCP